MPTPKLLDRQLARLYFDISRHHKECVQRTDITTAEIYKELFSTLHFSLTAPNTTLNQLPSHEHEKAFHILKTFFSATPKFRQLPKHEQHRLLSSTEVAYQGEYPYCCTQNGISFSWEKLGAHNKASSTKSSSLRWFGQLILITLAAIASGFAFIALYYVLNQSVNNVERLCYNEGWMKAALSFFSMAAAGIAAAYLAYTYLQMPLMILAFVAGLNPMTGIILGIGCLCILAAAVGGFITNKMYDYISKKVNADALDPQDTDRIDLTKDEVDNLMHSSIDLIKVKCAIVAIRAHMGDKQIPSLVNRIFTSKGAAIQEHLDMIRKLRRGQISYVSVGEMEFNCLLQNEGSCDYQSLFQAPPPYTASHHQTIQDAVLPAQVPQPLHYMANSPAMNPAFYLPYTDPLSPSAPPLTSWSKY